MGALRRQVAVAFLCSVGACRGEEAPPSAATSHRCRPIHEPTTATAVARSPVELRHAVRAVARGDDTLILLGTGELVDLRTLRRAALGGPVFDLVLLDAGEPLVLYGSRGQAGGCEIVRFTSVDGGQTFSAGAPIAALASTSCWLAHDGRRVFAAVRDHVVAIDPAAPPGTVPETWASGLSEIIALDRDPVSGEIWAIDRRAEADVIVRLARGAHDSPPAVVLPKRAGAGWFARGSMHPRIAGKFVYNTAIATTGAPEDDVQELFAVDRFGPSGPPQISAVGYRDGMLIGRGGGGELWVTTSAGGVAALADDAPEKIETSLAATGCLDEESAISYDVRAALWSDGATKQRAVIMPPDGRARVMPDGDLRFPVGTVAVKTFSRAGRRIETRLFVQRALDDWMGLTYAWNDSGTDAGLVVGNAIRDGWYFPSSSDCNACHTPAAGYTLGLEGAPTRT